MCVFVSMYIRRIIRQSGAIKARSNHINHGSFRSPSDTLRLEIELVSGIGNGIPSALAICIANNLVLFFFFFFVDLDLCVVLCCGYRCHPVGSGIINLNDTKVATD